jgi:hypothetical protein
MPDELQKLKEKAAFKNPDEFYFKMIKSRTANGIHKPKYVQCSSSAPFLVQVWYYHVF